MTGQDLYPQFAEPIDYLRQGCDRPWEVAIDPFEVAPRTWYVGNRWVGAYLLESTDGLILIDTTMQPQVYLVFESIRKLGFDPGSIQLILLSHMHYDHVGGARALQEASGATLMMSREDWAFMNDRPDQVFDSDYPFGRFEVEAFYDDDTPVVLGDRTIRTLLTPGHTPGTTSFFFDVPGGEGETMLLCGLHGGVGLNTLTDAFLAESGLPVSNRDAYLAAMLRVRQFPVDITLGSHPAQVNMLEKVAEIRPGHNPFHDPEIWGALIDGRIAQVRELIGDAT